MKKPIGFPYLKLKAHCETLTEVPLRKQVCLQFLRWMYTVDKKDKTLFIDLIKRWRTEDNRTGMPRTLLERKARKLFKAHTKHKKLAPTREGAKKWCEESLRKEIGVHTPERRAKLREHNIRIRQIKTEKDLASTVKNWVVYSPTGEVFYLRTIFQFCKDRGLYWSNLGATHNHPGKLYKGWRAEKINEEWTNL